MISPHILFNYYTILNEVPLKIQLYAKPFCVMVFQFETTAIATKIKKKKHIYLFQHSEIVEPNKSVRRADVFAMR